MVYCEAMTFTIAFCWTVGKGPEKIMSCRIHMQFQHISTGGMLFDHVLRAEPRTKPSKACATLERFVSGSSAYIGRDSALFYIFCTHRQYAAFPYLKSLSVVVGYVPRSVGSGDDFF